MPGALVVDPRAPKPQIRLVAYGPEQFLEEDIRDPQRIAAHLGKWPVVWVNVAGLGDVEAIGKLGTIFGLHPLALEDVINVHQRAKVEEYGEHLFIVARVVVPDHHVHFDQVSMFLGKGFVVSFQEQADECFTPVMERLRASRGHLRAAGPDLLTYALLDTAIDSYFPALDRLGERLDVLDTQISPRNADQGIGQIHELRSELLVLRRAIWPHREAVNQLIRDPHPLVLPDTRVYLRDCYDHTVQLIDLLETYREMASDLRDFVLSMVSNRLNEIMKVLTIIATIFIPLSFIAGVYGMNFDTQVSPWNMPELKWYMGYPFAMGLMAATAAGLLHFFWRRGWLGSSETMDSPANHEGASKPPAGDQTPEDFTSS